MWVGIIIGILLTLLACAIAIILILRTAIINELMQTQPQIIDTHSMFPDEEEVGKSAIISTIYFGADYDAEIVDFSQYEEQNIIGFTMYIAEVSKSNEESGINGIPCYIPEARVFKHKQYGYRWETL